MGRIRTVKPEAFTHEGLYELEIEIGLPIRFGFAGLWTQADREGRFIWAPKTLKLGCLPHDVLDFSRVLDALWSRGHIEKYTLDSRVYGFIPSWSKHQVINNRESASVLPEPTEESIVARVPTGGSRVLDATITRLVHAQGEGKGKERNTHAWMTKSFEDFYSAYPKKKAKPNAEKAWFKIKPTEELAAQIMAGLERAKFSQEWIKDGGQYIPHPATWLNGGRWNDVLTTSIQLGGSSDPRFMGAK